MLIGLCGGGSILFSCFLSDTETQWETTGICAGKTSVANHLIEKHNFTLVTLRRDSSTSTPTVEKSATLAHVPNHAPESGVEALEFESTQALDEHVSQKWQQHFVLTTIWNEGILDAMLKRPFFIFVSIDAPVGVRWQRFKRRCARYNQEAPSLEDFVVRNDQHVYDPDSGLASLSARAQIRILNSATTLKQLSNSLDSLNLLDPTRLRPTWDQYFMQLADLAARRSNCMRRQVGCVVVREKRVISTGYNGTPRNVANCNEGGCPRCNTVGSRGASLSTCLCLHAEENALLEAGRERIGDSAVLYCNTYVEAALRFDNAHVLMHNDRCPCLTCSVKIVQVGITEVVFSQSYHMDAEVRYRRSCRVRCH